ncbi:MAG: ferredoxin, partial [Mycobacteriaceae bacterium]|nr:ferredoxin [Mycobacteriaceae bacterium]
LVRAELATCTDARTRHKLELLASLETHDDRDLDTHDDRDDRDDRNDSPRVRLAYRLTPARVLGEGRATGVEFVLTGTAEVRAMDAGLVLSSIGYRGRPVPGLPFDDGAAVVPNRDGRVVDPEASPLPGSYVAGWIKRGPTGFIGTNKSCAQETVNALVDDYNDGRLPDPVATLDALDRLVRCRQPQVIDRDGWRAIDTAEISRGQAAGRPREKFASVVAMLAAAADRPPPRRRLLAALQR